MRRANVRFTYSDYLRLPEDKRYEILDGELHVVPAPSSRHQRVAINLEVALFQYAKATNSGLVYHAPYDVVLSEDTVVQPDIIFIRHERAAIISEMNLQGQPDIAVEILSPTTRSKDLEVKRKIYAQFGILEYWIVDPDAGTVEVLIRPEAGYVSAGVYGITDRLSSPLLPDLNLPLSEIFKNT